MEWWSNGLVQNSITPTLHYSILLRTSAPRIAEVATAFQIVCFRCRQLQNRCHLGRRREFFPCLTSSPSLDSVNEELIPQTV